MYIINFQMFQNKIMLFGHPTGSYYANLYTVIGNDYYKWNIKQAKIYILTWRNFTEPVILYR